MLVKKILLLIVFVFIINCTEKTTYSGMVLNENINSIDYITKNDLVNSIGDPNYIDPIENKYFYYSEKNNSTGSLNV